MRALLTGGIKAILAIAALSTAAHWALRVQRDTAVPAPSPAPALAALPDPATTGSIAPRRIERPAASLPAASATPAGLDQDHLAALIAGATQQKPRAAKPNDPAKAVVARTAAAKADPAKTDPAKTAAVKPAVIKTAAADKPVEKPAAKR